MAEPTTLDRIGEYARFLRGKISPFDMFSANDVASFAPGGGITQAGTENFPKAMQAYRSGDYGTAALEGLSGALGAAGDMLWAAGPAAGAIGGTTLKALGRAVKPEAKAAQGIRAFHGSPHDFDRFDMSKIGTGEGAQAYGHGLYFAENEGVAKAYRDQLAPNVWGGAGLKDVFLDGKRIEQNWPGWKRPEGAAVEALNDPLLGATAAEKAANLRSAGLDDAAKWLEAHADRLEVKQPGRMYEVRINADPEHFLDWDKPLSEQSQKVREAWSKASDAERADIIGKRKALDDQLRAQGRTSPFGDGNPVESYKGAQDVQALIGSLGKERATDVMREAGIPGIKYLDAGSRAAGDGSRNYVVFDDSLIQILKKYGWVPGAAIPAGAMLEYTRSQQQQQGPRS